METMTIVFATNDRGFLFLKVAVGTAVRNLDSNKSYEIVILEGEGGLTPAHRQELEALTAGRIGLRFVDVDPYLEKYGDRLRARNPGKSLMIWSRCFMGEILPDVVGNALYLDTDVYVNGDLEELFRVDLGSAMVGMVPEAGAEARRKTMFGRSGIPEGLQVYCNAGVMLFSPSAWHRERADEKLIDWALTWPGAAFHDQDAVNAVFWDRIKVLPTKWNYHDGWVERSCRMSARQKAWQGNAPVDVLEAIVSPRILHYWGCRKPWKFNHRPERKRYERAMRELGLVRGHLEGSTFARRMTLLFWDALHRTMVLVAGWRHRRLVRRSK